MGPELVAVGIREDREPLLWAQVPSGTRLSWNEVREEVPNTVE